MAAIETPWIYSMSKSAPQKSSNDPTSPRQYNDPNPPTVAAFAPTSNSGYSATAKQRSTIIVHKKSPLLVATPPQITRALAHSHPFVLPLNKLLGLLSWSTEDPYESFLLLAAFWAITLYGSQMVRYGGPIIFVTFLIVGMYSRRYSPLSSTSKTGEKHEVKSHKRSESTSPQHKSLDEIVDVVQQFTTRCNILLDPFLTMTDFLSTQRTPTSATTRPALTTLFIRILLVTPLWILLTLPPFYILTSRRIILATGTIILTRHSRPARVSRVILWRSVFIRRLIAFATGLNFDTSPSDTKSLLSSISSTSKSSTSAHPDASELIKKRRPNSSGVRFTFILYENQRRWLGLGWTTSLFAYERSAWTDEHLNTAPARDEFELPDVDGGTARWRWVKGSSWQIENGDSSKHRPRSSTTSSKSKDSSSTKDKNSDTGDGGGWIYYDNKWNDGRLQDGWGRYTRRRKWFRDAELFEITPSMEPSPIHTPVIGQSDVEADNDDESAEAKIRRAKAYAQTLSPDRAAANLGSDPMGDSVATIVPSSKSSNTAPGTPVRPSHSRTTSSTSFFSATNKHQREQSQPQNIDTSINVNPNTNTISPPPLPPRQPSHSRTESVQSDYASSTTSSKRRSGWFGIPSSSNKIVEQQERSPSKASSTNTKGSKASVESNRSRDAKEEDMIDPWRDRVGSTARYGGLAEDLSYGLS